MSVFDVINKILWFIGLILLQVLLLDKITVAGVATPMAYIYLLMLWNRNGTRWILLLVGFVLGIIIDCFENMAGVNASACVLLAMLQPIYLNLFIPRELQDEPSVEPSLKTLGWVGFMKYALFCVFTHHLVVLALEYFALTDMVGMLTRIVGCMALTILVVLIFELIRRKDG
ncbi:MAG: rod shape-determining protein MreD [Bacteroidaceae bacterium]|nr:rod shape-determining protein MreD [Bacteroidaceae bacterium]